MPSLRILLVDDNALLCEALRSVLECQADLQVIGSAETGAEGLRLARELVPDVVLLDVTLPDARGTEIARGLRALPTVKVVALSGHEDASVQKEMLSAGAHAYVPKSAAPASLLETIRQVGGSSTECADDAHQLELRVLKLFGQGHPKHEIAATLGLHIDSVEQFRVRAMQRRELKTRGDVARFLRSTASS